MTRNFEDEYKKYADSTVPDLWDRIESAIDDKETVSKKSHKNSTVVFFRRYSGLAIACACVLITIGALKFIGSFSKSSSSEMGAYASMDTAPAMEEADTAVNTEASAEAAAEAVAEAATDAITEAPAEATEKKETSAQPNYAADISAPAAAMAEEAEEERSDDAKTAGASLEIVCTVKDKTKLTTEHKITVTVIKPMSSGLDEGSEIVLDMQDEAAESLSQLLKDNDNNEYIMFIEPDGADKYTLLDAKIK